MKKNEKVMIVALLAITILVILFALNRKDNNASTSSGSSIIAATNEVVEEEQYVTTTEDGTKVNTSSALSANKTVNDIEFSEIQLTERGGETVLLATVTNKGSVANDIFAVNITLIDDTGKDITTITGLVAPLEPGATANFQTSTTLDFANAYDFRVSVK